MSDPNELWRGGSTERQACIPAPLRDLHRTILRQFMQTGTPPTAAWITWTAARLGLPDERQALEDGRGVVAVAGRGPGRGREQALVFPEPDRLGRHPGPAGRLADPHPRTP